MSQSFQKLNRSRNILRKLFVFSLVCLFLFSSFFEILLNKENLQVHASPGPSVIAVFKGEWGSAVSYKEGDIIWYDDGGTDKTYKALRDNENKNPATETTDWEYQYDSRHKFVVPEGIDSVDVLMVAGGGSGGNEFGGGGGAGGVIEKTVNSLTENDYLIVVGKGGEKVSGRTYGNDGENTTAFGLTAIGGGGGGRFQSVGKDGGSGSGGGGRSDAIGGAGLQPGSIDGGYGNNGGQAIDYSNNDGGGGGGGADEVGGNATTVYGGAGGSGKDFSAKYGFNYGEDGYFAGGGGGGTDCRALDSVGGSGGIGGGGVGAGTGNRNGEGGIPNTGGGGGGGCISTDYSGDGGSGIVIVKYEEETITIPIVETNSATSITLTSATLNGTLTDLGGATSTDVWFKWDTDDTFLDPNTTAPETKTATTTFNVSITNLDPGTTYYFQAVAENSAGIATGTIESFSTQSTAVLLGKGKDAYQLEIEGKEITGYLNNSSLVTGQARTGWNHVMLTYDKNSSEIKLYINDAEADSAVFSESIAVNSNRLKIGEFFLGKMDETKIYNRALSAKEISQNYDSGGRMVIIDSSFEIVTFVSEPVEETLIFYDDFSSDFLNADKWQMFGESHGSISVGAGELTISQTAGGGSGQKNIGVASNINFPIGAVLKARVKNTSGRHAAVGAFGEHPWYPYPHGAGRGTSLYSRADIKSASASLRREDDSTATFSPSVQDYTSYQIVEIHRTTDDLIEFYVDEVKVGEFTNANLSANYSAYFSADGHNIPNTIVIDWVEVTY